MVIKNEKAFTLAEVLIVLLIIGVVAVLTLPALIANINAKVLKERTDNIVYKLTQSTTKMVAAGDMEQFINTLAFVQKLEKHYSISKVCLSNQLRGCWPYQYVTLSDGTQWDISKTTSGDNLKMPKDDNDDYTGQTVGIVTADGTAMIMAYNTKCVTFDPAKTYAYTGFTNATTGCIAVVFDANGSKNPNTVGKDVVLLNANGLGNGAIKTIGIPCSSSTNWNPCRSSTLQVAEADAIATEYKGKNNGGVYANYYAADEGGTGMSWGLANKTCTDLGLKLPNDSELQSIYRAYNSGLISGITAANYWTNVYDVYPDAANNCYMGNGNCGWGTITTTDRRVRCIK